MAQICHPCMVMRIFLSIILFLITIGGASAAVCPVSQNSNCSYNVLQCCDNQFQQTLGLSNCTGAFYSEPTCHQKQLEGLYEGGTQGLFKICSAWSAFYQCLGPASGDCTSMSFHMANGMDLGTALQLLSIYKQYQFACGAGLEAFANADTCMSAVFTKDNKITTCRNQFANNLNAQWDQRCIFFAQYNGCFANTFRNACGTEAGWWGCEYARQGARTLLHECNEQCSATLKLNQPAKANIQFDKEIFKKEKKTM